MGRFLPTVADGARPRYVLVQNFFEELRQRAPNSPAKSPGFASSYKGVVIVPSIPPVLALEALWDSQTRSHAPTPG